MKALVVRFNLRDEASATEFDALTEEAVQLIRDREPGTLVYATHAVDGEPLSRVFYEVYANEDALQTHETAEHVISFHRRKNPHVASHRVEFLAPGAVKGLPS